MQMKIVPFENTNAHVALFMFFFSSPEVHGAFLQREGKLFMLSFTVSKVYAAFCLVRQNL